MAVTRPTATVPLVLDAHPADRLAWAVLAERERRLTRDTARTSTPPAELLADIDETRAQMQTLQDSIATGIITVTVQGLSRGAYRNLLKNHPPTDDDIDQKLGYNADTFGAALLHAATISAVDSRDMPIALNVAEWVDDDEGVGPGDFQRWYTTAQSLNNRPVDNSPQRRAS